MKIEHVALWAKDLDAVRDFYVSFFSGCAGERYVNARTGFASYFVSFDSGTRLEIMQMPGIPESADDPEAQATGLIHLAFSVGGRDAVNALTERLREAGFHVASEPRTTGDGYYESVVFDPEGNRVEITE